MQIATDIPLSEGAAALLADAGATLTLLENDAQWGQLNQAFDGLLFSGRQTLPAAFYEQRGRLAAVALLGRDERNIDLPRATRAGLLVLEPARGEAASIADFALAQVLTLARSRSTGPMELDGKVLGLVGFGPVAAQVARRAKAFGMELLVWDAQLSRGRAMLYNCEPMPLVDLLVRADVVINLQSLQDGTRGRFGKDEIQLLKEGAVLIHLADPQVLRWDEVVRALDWGYLDDFAIDLPPGSNALATELRPYLGARVSVGEAANTLEARQGIHLEMAADLISACRGEDVETAVNVPHLRSLERRSARPWQELARVLGAMLGARLGKRPHSVELALDGGDQQTMQPLLAGAFCMGLAHALGETEVNAVSATLWAEEAGITLRWSGNKDAEGALSAAAIAPRSKYIVGGSVRYGHVHVTRLDHYHLTAEPTEHLLLVPHANRPGMVGQVGTLLGQRQVNIRGMVLGQKREARDTALMWIMLDQEPPADLLDELAALPSMLHPEYIHIPPTTRKETHYA